MKFSIVSLIAIVLFSSGAFAQPKFEIISNLGVSHISESTYRQQTKNFNSLKTLQKCLSAGEGMPKR